MKLNKTVLARHQQISNLSCVPMSVEFVLKLLDRMPFDKYFLQNDATKSGTSDWVENFVFNGIRFKRHFYPPNRNKATFDFDSLFDSIKLELARNKYVIITLPSGVDFHNYIIYEALTTGEFKAITKNGNRDEYISDVRKRVEDMGGTDIITYEKESCFKMLFDKYFK